MKKVILLVIILLVVGVGYTKFFVNIPFGVRDVVLYEELSDGSSRRVYCGGYEDPDISVVNHLDNPIQKLLSIKTIFTKEDLDRNKHVYKSYTIFGLPISTVEVDCKTGSIQTVKGL